MRSKQQGVTLIELMIVVAVVAILAAIAYPSYRNQILRSHRSEGKAALLQVQVAQEKFFLQNNAYATTDALITTASTAGGLGILSPTTSGHYVITFTAATATSYTAQAAAQGGQTGDTGCQNLTIDNTGARLPAACW
jgi:type IV pilus assembly protein PilE